MGIDFTNIVSNLNVDDLASNMSKIINEALPNYFKKFLWSKNCLATFQINRNICITAHFSYLILSMSLNFSGIMENEKKEKHGENNSFVLDFVKTALKSYE